MPHPAGFGDRLPFVRLEEKGGQRQRLPSRCLDHQAQVHLVWIKRVGILLGWFDRKLDQPILLDVRREYLQTQPGSGSTRVKADEQKQYGVENMPGHGHDSDSTVKQSVESTQLTASGRERVSLIVILLSTLTQANNLLRQTENPMKRIASLALSATLLAPLPALLGAESSTLHAVIGIASSFLQTTQKPMTQFRPDQTWLDDDGVAINAHGGGVMFHEDRYYWFGQHMIAGSAGNRAHVGVHCYSSMDLYNWKNEGVALAVSKDPAQRYRRGLHPRATQSDLQCGDEEVRDVVSFGTEEHGLSSST